MIEKKGTSLLLAAACVLAACGGGDGGGAAMPTSRALTTAAGKVVDGYLSAASVVCDANNNGVADSDESVVVTDSQGNFAFSPACSSSIVASGGTSIDTGLPFTGLLKAPAGSIVVTPLTSLMATNGLTATQVAAALELPVGTDVTQVDPAATNPDGTMVNANLLKKNLAVHQIVQQITDTLGNLAQDASVESTQAIYSEVVNAVATTLAANSPAKLIDSSGSISSSLVSGIVQKSTTNVASTTNAALGMAKTSLGAYSAASVSALVSAAITSQAETLGKSTDAALTEQTTVQQSNPIIANAASQLAPLLTTDNADKVDLTALGTALRQLATADKNNDTVAHAALAREAATQAGKASIPPLSIDAADLREPDNYFAIPDDSIELNGQTYTLPQFMNGVPLAQKPSPINTIGFEFIVKGNPIPKNSQGVRTTKVSLAIEVSERGAGGRVLQFLLDQADLTVGSNKELLISVPADSHLYFFGQTGSGITVSKTLTNLNVHQFVAVEHNTLTLNAEKVLSQIGVTNLANFTGTFHLRMAVSNVKIWSQVPRAVTGMSITVPGSIPRRVIGLGVQGTVMIQ